MSTRRRPRRPRPGSRRSGVALLLSVLVLIVVISIVFQIQISTMTSARVTRNDVGLTTMDLAAESAALEIYDLLLADAEAAEGGAGGGAPGGVPAPGAGGEGEGGAGGAGGEQAPPADSREDEWARPQRPEVNGIQMRVLVQDEDSKYNVLNMLAADEDLAREARERVRRILDLCREGTRDDIGSGEAEDMVRAMSEYMAERDRFQRARPVLLTEDEEDPNRVLPFSLKEFATLEPFEPRHFRDYRDEDGERVHSIGSFLTLWSSPTTASEAGGAGGAQAGGGGAAGSGQPGQSGQGGTGGTGAPGGEEGEAGQGGDQNAGAQGGGGSDQPAAGGAGAQQQGGGTGGAAGFGVNVNTASPTVLKALLDRRDVSTRFWDDVIEYRNEEEEQEEEPDVEADPIFDEYGREVVPRQFFDTLDELGELPSWDDYDAETQEKIRALLTTQSQVFSIYITARRSTSAEEDSLSSLMGEDRAAEEERSGSALVRTVRIVAWRRSGADGPEIVPIIPWEVLDYSPYEIRDYPEDERRW